MADLAVSKKWDLRGKSTESYVITNALQIYAGGAVGIDDGTGLLVNWSDVATKNWLGIAQQEVLGNTSASPPAEVSVDCEGQILQRVAVTGASAQGDVGDLVYLTSSNFADLTKTATTNVNAIGSIVRWYSSTTCDVRLFTPDEYRALIGA